MILDNITLPSLPEKGPIKILFVCLGNICRSPAADGMMKSLVKSRGTEHDWYIDSAGTSGYHSGELPDQRMRVHALQRGLKLDHICRKIKGGDFEKFDIIIGMDNANVSDLTEMAPSVDDEKKIVRMADFFSPGCCYDYVPDPYYEGSEGFEIVLDLLEDATLNLYDTITAARKEK